jgi:hypothetical protein
MFKKLTLTIVALLLTACGKFEAARRLSPHGSSKAGLGQACSKKLSGKWDFGYASYGCAMPASAAIKAEVEFKTYVLNESVELTTEKTRFAKEMYSFLSDYSQEYLKRREPDATNEDIDAWTLLILATAHQESYWTQYRLGEDQFFRFFRGDGGHGYGLMQVDDRWHKSFIRSEKVYDLNAHMIYAMDLLYENRKIIKKSPCSGASTNDDLNRSIYSAYNGGAKSKCRWQNSSHVWARNDKNFYTKYTEKSWEKAIQ